MSVFIATSDEALPILLSNITQDGVWLKLLVLILSKLVLALAAGYAVDIVQKVRYDVGYQITGGARNASEIFL